MHRTEMETPTMFVGQRAVYVHRHSAVLFLFQSFLPQTLNAQPRVPVRLNEFTPLIASGERD